MKNIVDRSKRIRSAYRLTAGNSFYDDMITCSTFLGRFISRLVWDMNAEDSAEYQMQAMSGIPDMFSGRLLEVPVGTGVITMPLYCTMPEAEITCLDYSPEMLIRAQEKGERLGLKNIVFQQGDVGMLPFADSSFDVVISLNGFHAFPDKEAAYQEIFRVLNNGGTFCGCFYVAGACKRTDFFIRCLYQPMKFFSPPYETVQSLDIRLKSMYKQVKIGNIKGIAYFTCRKNL